MIDHLLPVVAGNRGGKLGEFTQSIVDSTTKALVLALTMNKKPSWASEGISMSNVESINDK